MFNPRERSRAVATCSEVGFGPRPVGHKHQMTRLISAAALKRRAYWVEEIRKLSGHFGDDSDRLENELREEIARDGPPCLIDHLRLCGDIPESYEHDSSEEKLYSKYTDALLSEAYKAVGLKSVVLKERADAADVEAFAKDFGFVGDAKAFRLSRTAKNQKDFKVQAMDGWKRGKPFAMIVCPIYHLPARASQIYQQATSRNVCIFTFSHLAMLVAYSHTDGQADGVALLRRIFETVNTLNPSKDAYAYWFAVNKTMLGFSNTLSTLWSDEKRAAIESIAAAKEEALTFLARERERIMIMSHDEALVSLLRMHKIDNRAEVIRGLANNNILGMC